MAGILDSMMHGYTERILGSERGGGDEFSAQNTAAAYKNLQDAIAADYEQQRKMFESNPANAGQSWQAPGTEERFQDQVQAMILSGDPALQKRGLALISAPDSSMGAADREFANLRADNPNLTYSDYFRMKHPGPGSTNVSVNLPKMDQPMSLSDLQLLSLPNGMPVPVGASMREAGAMGAQISQTKEQSEKGAAAQTAASSITRLGDNINAAADPKTSVLESLRTAPGIIGKVTSVGLNAAGVPANEGAVKFQQSQNVATQQLLKIMSGASATEGEFERIQNNFPQLTDDKRTRAIKYNSMLDQTQAIVERAKSQGATNLPDMSKIPRVPVPGAPKKPEAPAKPKATKRFNPATGKIEDIQ